MRTVFIGLLIYIGILSAHQGFYPVTTYSDNEVPSIGRMVTMYQDTRGWMWFGGELGAMFYDGQNFYKFNRTSGLPDNYVFRFVEDSSTRIWICTYDGLGIYDPHTGEIETVDLVGMDSIRDILFLENRIFLATDGNISYIENGKRFHIPLPDIEQKKFKTTVVRSLLPDTTNSVLWAATEQVGLVRIDWKALMNLHLTRNYSEYMEGGDEDFRQIRKHTKNYYVPGVSGTENVLSVARHPDGTLYSLTLGGIFKIDGPKLTPVNKLNTIYPNCRYLQIDKQGRFILKGPRGLALVDGEQVQWFKRENGLASSGINAAYIDQQENLWIASGNGLIQKISNLQSQYWDEKSLPGFTNVIQMMTVSEKAVLIATRENLWEYSKNEVFPYHAGLQPDELITGLAKDGNGQTIVITTQRICVLQKKRLVTLKKLSNAGYTRATTFLDNSKRLWIVLGYEVWIWDGKSITSSKFLKENLSFALMGVQAQDGTLFFGTWKGLYGIFPDKIKLFTRAYHRIFLRKKSRLHELYKHVSYNSNKFNSEVMTGGAVDADGRLWFCSLKGDLLQERDSSLYQLNPEFNIPFTNWITMKKIRDDLIYVLGDRYYLKIVAGRVSVLENPVVPDVTYADLVVDGEGTEYFATSRGLLIHKEQTWFHISGESGLPEQSVAALLITSDKHLLLRHEMGITGIPLRSLTEMENKYHPPLVIGVQNGSRLIVPEDKGLQARDQRNRIFKATYGDLTDANLIRFSWRLKGFEPNFSEWKREGYAHYTNLPPGSYTFEVRATSMQHGDKIRTASIPVVIKPFFWETWYFKAILFLAILLVAYSAYLVRLQAYKRREERLNQLVKERTHDLQVFSMLANASGLSLLILSPEKKVIYTNPSFYRMMGWQSKSTEWDFFNIFTGKTGEKVRNEIFDEVEREGQWLGELNVHRGEGAEKLTTIQNIFKIVGDREMPTLFGVVITNITDRKKMENKLRKTTKELKEALENIKVLSGLVPICASCKKIRNDGGFWQQVEEYISEHTEAKFSHGICPDCLKKLYPEFSINHECKNSQ